MITNMKRTCPKFREIWSRAGGFLEIWSLELEVIILPEADFDALKSREGYRQRANGDLERVEGSLVYVIVRQQSNPSIATGTLEKPYG